METKMIAQGFGVLIVLVMALSMLAGAYLYSGNQPNNNNPDQLVDVPQPIEQEFKYTISFDTNVLKELNTTKIALITSTINKATIDNSIQKIEGVATVTSQFNKTQIDANEWTYIADITLKKNASLTDILGKIMDLNYFDKTSGFDAMKNISISAPPWVIIHNIDLNTDRNYAFTQPTLLALARLPTIQGDQIRVSGNITLQGKIMTSISLFETQNLSQTQRIIDTNEMIENNIQIQGE